MEEWDQVTLSIVNVNGKNLPKANPPPKILVEAHKKWKVIPDNSALLAIAKEDHFPQKKFVSAKRGAKKATAKQRERRTNLRQRTDMSNVCRTCNSEEPPLTEDDNDEDDKQND